METHVLAECEVEITREINAPRELVFQAWSNAEQLTRWFAPNGCAVEFRRLDFQPGGTFHSCIHTPDGKDCWCTGVYLDIAAPERIVYTIRMSDAEGNDTHSADVGKDNEWPDETTVTVNFADEGGKTRLTLHQTVSEELAKRTGAYPSWLQMLDRLEEELVNH